MQNSKDALENWYSDNKQYIKMILIAIIPLLIGYALIFRKTLSSLLELDFVLSFLGALLVYIASLFIMGVMVKILLITGTFKDVIFKIFTKIFIEREVQNIYDKNSLIKLANHISEIEPSLKIINDSQKAKAIEELEKYWAEKIKPLKTNLSNHIIIESDYTTTYYRNSADPTKSHAIITKKQQYKMMRDGSFEGHTWFRPFDKNTDINIFKQYENLNRWSNKSYSIYIEGLNLGNVITTSLSNYHSEEENGESIEWIGLKFSSPLLKKGETFTIELSISDIINENDVTRMKEYFRSYYKTPHAIRNVKFQIETYGINSHSLLQSIQPILSIGETQDNGDYKKNVYYETWLWQTFWCNEKQPKIQIKIF